MAILYRVDTVVAGLAGAPYFNQMYFDGLAGTPAQAHAAVAAFLTSTANQVSTNCTATVQGDVSLIESTTAKLVGVASVTPVSIVGTSNNSPNPLATQGLLRFRTGVFLAGREIRGRMYLWGSVTTQDVSGAPIAAYRTAWDAALTTLVGVANADLVVYSRTALVFARVTGGSTWEKWAVLRSRRD